MMVVEGKNTSQKVDRIFEKGVVNFDRVFREGFEQKPDRDHTNRY